MKRLTATEVQARLKEGNERMNKRMHKASLKRIFFYCEIMREVLRKCSRKQRAK